VTALTRIALALALLAGCATPQPALLTLEPPVYEDALVRLDYRLGSRVYYLRVTNKTDDEMFVDMGRVSIISTSSETRSVGLSALDSHVPPHSQLTFVGNAPVFFSVDIDSDFEETTPLPLAWEWWELGTPVDREVLTIADFFELFVGSSVRLFVPIRVAGEEHLYDVELVITGSTALPEPPGNALQRAVGAR
jgi:hypothetical protein